MKPRPGEEFHVGSAASVQFAGNRAILVRVIRVDPRPTYVGWCWLETYVLAADGTAIDRRTIFVKPAGLRPVRLTPTWREGHSAGRPDDRVHTGPIWTEASGASQPASSP